MQLSLTNLPDEIVERFVILLDLEDISSLRLSCRGMARKATQKHFRTYYRSKHVDLTESDLRAFVDATQPGRLGREVQHIILVGVVNNTKFLEYTVNQDKVNNKRENSKKKRSKAQVDLDLLEQWRVEHKQLHESGMDVSLLAEAFRNIAGTAQSQRPLALSLEVAVYREDAVQRLSPASGGGWRLIWKAAAETFHTALRSLTVTRLPIERLEIFNGRHLQRCSLASNEFSLVDIDGSGLVAILANLKSLSISFSNKFVPFSKRWAQYSQDQHDDFDWDASDDEKFSNDARTVEAADTDNFIGFTNFLQLCGQLQELELHQYKVDNFGRRADNLHGRLLQHVASAWSPPSSLRRVELRGVDVGETDLLQLIKRLNVRRLSMYHIRKPLGTFKDIFDFCSSKSADMDELYLHQLIEEDFLHVFFDGPGPSDFHPMAGPLGSDTLNRCGSATKQPIIYRSAADASESSPERALQNARTRIEYGPVR